jgi:hypothetical protein
MAVSLSGMIVMSKAEAVLALQSFGGHQGGHGEDVVAIFRK